VTEDRKLVEQLEVWGAELDADARVYDQAGPSVSIHADGIKKEAELLLAAADRIRALEGERDEAREIAANFTQVERFSAMKARAERLQAQVEELREGLRPFAEVPLEGEYGGPMVSVRILYEDMMSTSVHVGTKHLKPSDFRRAHSLLSKQEKEGTPND
jgi:hypothetical protein